MRVPYYRFETELFRNNGVMLGRYDARYTSYMLDRLQERPDFDAVDSAIDAAFVATGNTYVRDVLGYHTTAVYLPTVNVFRQWDWKHNGALPTNTAQDLAAAMVFNPNLRIFSANGYYDFATPFFATVYTLNHLTALAGAAVSYQLRILRIRPHGLSAHARARTIPRRPGALVFADAPGRALSYFEIASNFARVCL